MKNDLRVKYKKIRNSIHSENLDNLIYNYIIGLDEFIYARDILIYYSINDEIDTLKLIKYSLEHKKRVFIPRCDDDMDFYLVKNLNDLVNGKFNIMVSKSSVNDYCNSICITPGICFDKAFYRIGYGKGYYDKFFNTYNGVKIGLCYDDCLIDDTYHDCYDIPVDIIVTDKGVKRYEKRKSN